MTMRLERSPWPVTIACDPGACVGVCLHQGPAPVLHSVQGPSEPCAAKPRSWGIRLGGCSARSERKCSIRHPQMSREGVTEPGDAALLCFSQPARQLPVEARVFMPKSSGQAPREQESPLHSRACPTRCTGKCGADAGQAHFGSRYKVNSNFLP